LLCLCDERPASEGVASGCPLCLWESWQLAAGKDLVITEQREQQYLLAMEFVADCASPDGCGHALPQEVIQRAARILKHLPPDAQRLAVIPSLAVSG
jgi:hypothetical protein